MMRVLVSACAIRFGFDLVNGRLRRHVEVTEAITPGAVGRIFRHGNFAPAPSLGIEDSDGMVFGAPNIPCFVSL